MNIELITTGGTIAKRYDEITGELVFDKEHIQKLLTQSRSTVDLNILPLMLKDSLDMDENDREILLKAAKKSSSKKILITHGTDTMTESAKKLSLITDKTIVLTGAMIPFAFKNSDALFNLGFALSSVQTLSHGVYICINGKIFTHDNVKKDRKRGIFETIY
jgi:L-asparaginase